MKNCSSCFKDKPDTAFYRILDRSGLTPKGGFVRRYGLRSQCKLCYCQDQARREKKAKAS